MVGNWLAAVYAGPVRCTVRRAAGGRDHQLGLRIRQAQQQHAVVQKGQHHRHQRRFLPTVNTAGSSEYTSRFAGKGACQPLCGRTIPEVFHGRCHIAEACGRTERQPAAFFQVSRFNIRRATVGYGRCRGLDHGRDRRHGTQPRFTALNRVDAVPNQFGELARSAVAGVIQNQNCQRG